MPSLVSISFISDNVMKFGVIKTSFGMIICMKITANTIEEPLKSITPNAYAARVEVTNCTAKVQITRVSVFR